MEPGDQLSIPSAMGKPATSRARPNNNNNNVEEKRQNKNQNQNAQTAIVLGKLCCSVQWSSGDCLQGCWGASWLC